MKVLVLSPWVPWPPHDGGRIRIFETVRHLARTHRVTLIAGVRSDEERAGESAIADLGVQVVTVTISGRSAAVLRRLGAGFVRRRPWIESFHWSADFAGRVRTLTADESWNVVHVEGPFLTLYLDAMDPACRAIKVLSMVNLETLRFRRELQHWSPLHRRLLLAWDQWLFPNWERDALTRYDGITAVSESERAWIERQAPDAVVELAPNGVDTTRFRPAPWSEATPALVFLGAMSYPPNVDAVAWFCDAIWPDVRARHPALKFMIVGRSPHRRIRALGRRPGIIVTGEVADVRPYIARASAVIVPVRSGGGTRLKILEAMAMARPVISTTLGAEGLDVTDGVDVLLADTPADFARRIGEVVEAPGKAARLGETGRCLAVTRYDWRICLEGIDRVYARLGAVSNRMPRPMSGPATGTAGRW